MSDLPIHNIPLPEALRSLSRRFLNPTETKVYLDADYSSIELRVAAQMEREGLFQSKLIYILE